MKSDNGEISEKKGRLLPSSEKTHDGQNKKLADSSTNDLKNTDQ
jgi:hypothetical protein